MVEWIEPLQLETNILNIFSGTPEIFAAVALMFIAGMSAFFRMRVLPMVFMLGLFFLMFSAYIDSYFLILFSILGGLMIGYTLVKLLK